MQREDVGGVRGLEFETAAARADATLRVRLGATALSPHVSPPVILHGKRIDQVVDRGDRATFVKEVLVTGHAVPLAMVRKRDASRDGTRAPILLVHGFGQNRYAWHLPSRSLANYLAREGYDVFNLDLRGHGRSRQLSNVRARGVSDYVHEDLPWAIEAVQALSGGRPVTLIGHSLGGLVSYAAAPSLGSAVTGIVAIGSPYHFTRGSFSLGAIAVLVGALHAMRVRPKGLAFPVSPIGRVMRSITRVAESPLYPIPLRGWHAGALEPEVLDEHLRLAFDNGTLGEMVDMFRWARARRFGGEERDYVERFEQLDLPLLVIAGENDDLAPPASVRPAFLRSRARDKTYRALPLGHIDLLVGRDAPRSTWRILTEWLDARIPAA